MGNHQEVSKALQVHRTLLLKAQIAVGEHAQLTVQRLPQHDLLAAAQHHVHNSREVRQTGFSVKNYSEKWPTATDGDTGGEA